MRSLGEAIIQSDYYKKRLGLKHKQRGEYIRHKKTAIHQVKRKVSKEHQPFLQLDLLLIAFRTVGNICKFLLF